MQPNQPIQPPVTPAPTPAAAPNTPKGAAKFIDGKKVALITTGVILGIIVVVAIIVLIINLITRPQTEDNPTENDDPGQSEVGTPESVDLQLAVDQWLTSQKADDSGIIIYDIDNDEVVARHNESKQFTIDTVYQMFLAYEGYYRIDHSMLEGTAVYPIGEDFDGKPYTRKHCLDYMVRFSYAPCAASLINDIGFENLQAAYKERGFKDTNISQAISTPSDLLKLYQMYWKHKDLSKESWDKIQESMLNQVAGTQDFTYAQNWRMGMPSGFGTALVYNKVGMYGIETTWLRFSDASFIVFPEVEANKDGQKKPARHFISIVLTTNTTPQEIVKLGRKVEEAIKQADNY